MDFFEKQARAQRRTKLLVFYFLLAICGIIATLQIIFALLLKESILDPSLLATVSGGVVVVVLLGSAMKLIELSQGGRVVAAMLGGEPIAAGTRDPAERKLLNVVEEMAIASGVPVPEVYVLPDETINAFAAGHGPGDTAIGVTRGCINQLTRDELQGVIGHEFSHILHGDMKLNLRLIGLLNGILGLALLGSIIMRSTYYGAAFGSERRNRDNNNNTAVFALAGLALYLVGWIGVFFGNLIKAAVSRQREFLADASSVQYTRNPDGIAGALWKIGQSDSRLSSPRAEEASHLYFGEGVNHWVSLFATHPPIDERIRAIDPGFSPHTFRPAQPPPLPAEPPTSPATALGRLAPLLGAAFADDAVRHLHDACALVYALLLDDRDDLRQAQLAALTVDDFMRKEVLSFFSRRRDIPRTKWLPLVDLAIPTLRALSPEQYREFRANVVRLVESDRQVHLFEFVLQKTLVRHLDLYFSKSTGAPVKYSALLPLTGDLADLLSALALAGPSEEKQRHAAFAAGAAALPGLSLSRRPSLDLASVDAALDRLAQATPAIKKQILCACRETVTHDDIVAPAEYELLRAVADTLDCPMPPLPGFE